MGFKKLIISFLFLPLFLLQCGPKKEAGLTENTQLEIAVIPKGTTHGFWKAIHAGAIKAAREFGVKIYWNGPQKEDDRAQQITVVEDFINLGVDGIVLAPLDDRALTRPVRDAVERNIPVVIIDSALQGDFQISYVATDNYKGGVLAAQRMGELLPEGGNLILIRYQVGSASTTNRERGFVETIKTSFPKINFLVEDQYAGATTETAYQLSENLLNRFSDIQGIFCPNESSTFGTLRALQESGRAGQIKFVGFDSSPKLVQGLEAGHIHGLILQDPIKIGYMGIKQMVYYLQGKTIDKRIDTGVHLITPDNMSDPEMKALLSPDLSPYLN
ncbi:MAG: substrate-binding domain-containing protein [Candidatus Aminicenantes bacterium]|nr:substrate-binding domain-containing protein [Candidatus Aminicenantes bacterium]